MHHAYLYEGVLSALPELARAASKEFGFTKEGDPDVQVLRHEKFGIGEARELGNFAALKSISGKMLVVVGVGNITTEAQQALLKLFEEPQAGAVFVLLAPHGSIIPTLRSRMLPYLGSIGVYETPNVGRSFLQLSSKARSAEVAKMLKNEENVRERVRDFLQGLEKELHEGLKKTKGDKVFLEGLQDIAKVRSYANDRSPSLKMLLEHLALTLPVQ